MPGFSLVATMTCMVLLMVIAMGMMSLSAVTVRKAGRDSGRLEAEANARMALMIAIAKVQEHLGPDQRVSGDARLAAQGEGTPSNPNWVSVWRTTQSNGEPWIRRDGEKGGLMDLRGVNRDPKADRLALLVSGNERSIKHEDDVTLDETNSAILVGERSIGSNAGDTEIVRAPLVALNGGQGTSGNYAWWVGDLGTKANVATRDASSEASSSELAMMLAQDASWQAFGTDDIPTDVRTGLVSDGQLALFDNNVNNRNFHGYTVWSAGLPINVRDGGWKRDLTAYLNSNGSIPDSKDGGNLPGLDDRDSIVGSANARVDQDSWDPGQSSRIMPVAPKFGLLRRWASRAEVASAGSYSATTETGDTITTSTPQGELNVGNSNKVVDFKNQTQSKLMPILAEGSLYYNLSYYQIVPADPRNPYGLRVHYYPRVVLWNPYNFELKVQDSAILLFVNGSKSVEMTLTDGVKRTYRMNWGGGGASRGAMYFKMSGTTLGPGESVVWSPATNRVYNETNFGQNLLSPSVAPSPTRSFYQDRRALDAEPLFELKNNTDPSLRLEHNRTSSPPIDWREVVPPTSSTNLQADMYTQADDYFMSWKPLSASSFNTTTFRDFPLGRFVSCAYQYGDEDEMPVEWTSLDPVPFPAMSGTNGSVNVIPDRRTRDGFRFRWSQETESNMIGSGSLVGTAHLEDSPIGNWNVRASYSFRNPFDNVTDVAPNFFGIYTRDLFDTEVDWNNMNPRAQNGKFLGDPFDQPVRAPQRRILFDVPRRGTEIASLGAFQHATLSEMVWHPTYVVGNSLVDPRVPQDRTEPDRTQPINRDKGGWNQDSIGFSTSDGRSNTNGQNATTNEDNWAFHARRLLQNSAFENTLIYDLTFEVNQTLWDSYFLSSGTDSQKKAFLESPAGNPLPNGRMLPNRMGGPIEDEDLTDFHRAASRLLVDGAFNVNSSSVEAWESLLLSNLGVKYNGKVAFPRFADPQDGTWTGGDATKNGAWAGQRVFSKEEIRTLAENIVRQVELRGPFLSMGDFVNRRLTMDEFGKKGALQAAIDESGLNAAFEEQWPLNNQQSLPDFQHPDHIRDATRMEQMSKPDTTAWGALGFLTQADLLQFLGPALTVRSDTFKVRAYGESHDKYGKVVARAWCEAIVQRTPGYVDPEDDMMLLPKDLNETNRQFGRRFRMVSFRWVKPGEV
jgi:hypothetical protein